MQNLTYFPPDTPYPSDNITKSDNTVIEEIFGPLSCYTRTTPQCYDIWREAYFLAVGAVIPIGLIFNTLALLVFATSWMRNTVPGRYFIALAIADNLVLIGELLSWINSWNSQGYRLGISVMHTLDWVCQFVNWLRYGARIWSSWITVAITIERFLTVTYPLKMAAYSNPRKSTVVCLLLFVASFGVSVFAFYLLRVGEHKGRYLCMVTDTVKYHTINLVIVGTLGELLVPSIVVLIFTILIIRSLAKAQKRRARVARLSHVNNPHSRETQPTIALLAIAIMFIVIRLPYMIIFIIQDIAHLFDDSQSAFSLYIGYRITRFLAVNNYAFNFLIFCIAGSTFRKQFVCFLKCQCRKTQAASDLTRSRSLSVERMNHFQVIRGSGRSASVDILCHVNRKVMAVNGNAVSFERLQNPFFAMNIRSVSVGAERLLHCQSNETRINYLQPLGHTFRKSFKTRPLTPESIGLDGSIPYIDDNYG